MDLFIAKRVAKVIGFFVALLAAIVGLFIFVSKEDERTAKRYLRHIERGELSAITEMIDAGVFNGRLMTVEHLKSALRQDDQEFTQTLITNWAYVRDLDGEFYDLLNQSPFETRIHFMRTMDEDSVDTHYIPERVSFLRTIQFVSSVDNVTRSIGFNSNGQVDFEYSPYQSGDDGLVYERQTLTELELPYDESIESLIEEAKSVQVKKFGIKPIVEYDEVKEFMSFLEYSLRMKDDSVTLALLEDYSKSDYYFERYEELINDQNSAVNNAYFEKRKYFRRRIDKDDFTKPVRHALIRNLKIDKRDIPRSGSKRRKLLRTAMYEKAFTTFESLVTSPGISIPEMDSLLLLDLSGTSSRIFRYCVDKEQLNDTLPQFPKNSVEDIFDRWITEDNLIITYDGVKNDWPEQFYDVALNSSFSSPAESLTVTDIQGRTALHVAAQYSGERMINQLLDTAPELLDKRDKKGHTALAYAALRADINIVDNLISRGCYVSDTLHNIMKSVPSRNSWSERDYEVRENSQKNREITRMIYMNRTSPKEG